MKIGIDSYCYHRVFGEVYPQQPAAPASRTVEWFIDRAHQLGVDGVSLESCFINPRNQEFLAQIREKLDGYGLDRVYAWDIPMA